MTNLIIHDHHEIKYSRILTIDKLSSTEIYTILISKLQNKPSSNFYFENMFKNLWDETPLHIFYECENIKCLWSDLVY